jgi:hypothetical protein
MRLFRLLTGVGVCCAVLDASAGDVMRLGRSEDAGRGFNLEARGGVITEFNAVVQETTRKLYDVMGEDWKQDRANNFDMDDFNVSGSHPVMGLGLKRSGQFVTFHLSGDYMSIASEAVARRDYFLNDVGPLVYNGREYDNMVIRDGETFSFEVDGVALDMRLQITPFTLQPVSGFRIVPFLDVGLFGFVGSYKIDAGAPVDLIQYQNPVEDFVVGGRVSGLSGLGLPEYGGGLELRFGQPDSFQFVLYGHYVVCQYKGGTSLFTSSSHREKNLEIDHQNIRVRAQAEFPLRSGRCWFLGGQYQQVQSDGLVESSATDPAVIIERRERFDKEFAFRMTMINAFLGMRF